MSDENFDFDEHEEDLLFLKAFLMQETQRSETTLHEFNERKVFHLSQGYYSSNLYYLHCTEDYNCVSVRKIDLLTNRNQLVLDFNVKDLSIEPINSVLNVGDFYVLDDDYVLFSFFFMKERKQFFTLIDSKSNQLIYFDPSHALKNMTYMKTCFVGKERFVFIKTGEYRDEEQVSNVDEIHFGEERMYLIEEKEFISRIINNNGNIEDYQIYFTHMNEIIADFLVTENQINILVRNIQTKQTILKTINIEQRSMEEKTYDQIYNKIYTLDTHLYGTQVSESAATLCDMKTGVIISNIKKPYSIILLTHEGIITSNMQIDECKLYITNDEKTSVLTDKPYFIDFDQNIITIIEEI